MARTILGLILLASFHSFAFGKTIVKEEKCINLANDVSMTAFSFDTNSMLYTPYELNKGKGAEYINKVRVALNDRITKFCKSDKAGVAIEEFRDEFHGACSDECQEQSSMFKDPLIGANRMKVNADAACLSICNKTRGKLDVLIDGIELGKSLTKKGSGDCSASVLDVNRGIIKTKDFDAVIENVKSPKATSK